MPAKQYRTSWDHLSLDGWQHVEIVHVGDWPALAHWSRLAGWVARGMAGLRDVALYVHARGEWRRIG